jgi:2-oxoisovalerate dehydrogenase E2 component (dihydrolipoyl transacylase)
MSELKEFRLADVGEGLTEADIVKWHVQPGDTVTLNQIVVEIETAKAIVELPCPYAGVVASLLAAEGTTVEVGAPLLSVQVGADAAPAAAGPVPGPGTPVEELVPSPPADGAVEPGMHGSPAPKQERQAVLVGYGVRLGATTRRTRKPSATPGRPGGPGGPAGPVAGSRLVPGGSASGSAGRSAVLAKPPVRKLAKDLGVDLSQLAGTGPKGSITRDDVQTAAAGRPAGSLAAVGGPAAAQPAAAAQAGAAPAGAGQAGDLHFVTATGSIREERIAVRGVRKHTAAAMVSSAFSAPHVTEFLQVDVTDTMAATARVKTLPEFAEVRVSPLLLVAKALLVAAARHPMINSSWDETAHEIVVKHYVNLGIAAATGRGLLVPNIKDAHLLALPDLGRALNELAETARAGRATVADLQGGTITLTNVGIFGVDAGTPILTPGEAAILAFGQIRDTPWVHGGQLAVRKVTTLSLSFDHRIVDGELGSAVLRDVGAMLADPLRMLAWS